ncbi:hypothetical protein Fcan01_23695 [Folsomia candida]|uniref:Uncharacterized protein n=1 Tax=Folsomia candida TaxID=158441 RepID=A0A226D7N5_FOLCA|nr:hypothetical protein Fcan01_23695 [Folsomia candida]
MCNNPVRKVYKNIKFRELATIRHSPEEHLISPGLWEILQTYVALYRHMLPFRFSVQERKLYLKKCSPLKITFLKCSSLLLLPFTLTNFVLLFDKLYFNRVDQAADHPHAVRTLAMFYITFLLPAFTPTGLTISFRAGSVCHVLNQIGEFHTRIKGLGKILYQLGHNKIVESGLQKFIQFSPTFTLLSSIGVLLNIEPLHVLGQALVFPGSNYILTLLRLCLYLGIIVEFEKSMCGFATVAIIGLAAHTEIIRRLRRALESWGNSATRVLHIFSGRLPLYLYCLAPATSLIGLVALRTVLPEAAMVWESSLSFLKFCKGKCATQYEVRLLRSSAAVGIAIGSLGGYYTLSNLILCKNNTEEEKCFDTLPVSAIFLQWCRIDTMRCYRRQQDLEFTPNCVIQLKFGVGPNEGAKIDEYGFVDLATYLIIYY